jgi:hypothetical protein
VWFPKCQSLSQNPCIGGGICKINKKEYTKESSSSPEQDSKRCEGLQDQHCFEHQQENQSWML